jgi:hypothetical protein
MCCRCWASDRASFPGRARSGQSDRGRQGRAGGSACTEGIESRIVADTELKEYTVKAVGTKDEGKPWIRGMPCLMFRP